MTQTPTASASPSSSSSSAAPIRAALVQMTSGIDPAANTATVLAAMEEAAAQGADWVLTPEMTVCLDKSRRRLWGNTCRESDDPHLAALRDKAAALGVTLLIGSMAMRADEDERADGRLANRSFLIGADGALLARYDKIHLFDVTLGASEAYRESRLYRPGDRAVVASAPDLPGGPTPVGLSVCYDVRFPGLYRALAEAGARIVTVPSAFTVPTGQAHWHVLLRARAIETGCFVLAPAQCGTHEDGRTTFGHSLAVDPWGQVLLDAGEGSEASHGRIWCVSLDLDKVDAARQTIPALGHARSFSVEG